MVRRKVQITNELGFHARAAARFVAVASRFASRITVRFGDKEMEGKSILGLLLLAAPCGATLEIRASGDDAAAAVKALVALVVSRFGEAP